MHVVQVGSGPEHGGQIIKQQPKTLFPKLLINKNIPTT
jgi:uncharacterized Zn-binding protein involved in type VI secretion